MALGLVAGSGLFAEPALAQQGALGPESETISQEGCCAGWLGRVVSAPSPTGSPLSLPLPRRVIHPDLLRWSSDETGPKAIQPWGPLLSP